MNSHPTTFLAMKSSNHKPQTPAISQSHRGAQTSDECPHLRLLPREETIAWPDSPPTPAEPASRSSLARTYPATTLLLAGLQKLFAPLARILPPRRFSPSAPCSSILSDRANTSSPARVPKESKFLAPAGIPGSTATSPTSHGLPAVVATACPPAAHKVSSVASPSADFTRR